MQQEREELVDYWKRTGRKVLWGTLLRHELEEAAANLVEVVRWFRATERKARGWPVPNDALSL